LATNSLDYLESDPGAAVLRKNLCQRQSASGLMQIRVVSCLLKNFIFSLSALCEAEFQGYDFNSLGSVMPKSSSLSSGNCCGMACSS
jgi:hypothetical protein